MYVILYNTSELGLYNWVLSIEYSNFGLTWWLYHLKIENSKSTAYITSSRLSGGIYTSFSQPQVKLNLNGDRSIFSIEYLEST